LGDHGQVHVVAAPDAFKGTASAADVAAAIARAVVGAGSTCDEVPLSDGGEGFVEVFGGANRKSLVTGPLGDPVEASWRLARRVAVIESAEACGLTLAGGPEENDPVSASTSGVGELIGLAVESGANRVLIGVGGSATTDGGLGALRALYPTQRLKGVDLVVACDVATRFVDAAEVFAPQKGATAAQVKLLHNRLVRLEQVYSDEYGIDLADLEGGGAAGGLAGALSAIGADIQSGFEVVAEELDLVERFAGADLIVTGEGFLDAESFDGKVVGGVVDLAEELGIPVLAVVGEIFDGADERVDTISMVRLFGEERSVTSPLICIEEAVAERLTG
jgi:glycerate 2-kinase